MLRSSAAPLATTGADHISDLAAFATARWIAGAASPLVVIAPSGPVTVLARRCLDAFEDQSFYGQAAVSAGPRPVIEVHLFIASREVSVVRSVANGSLSSVFVDDRPVEPSVGYLIEHRRQRVAVSGDTAVCGGWACSLETSRSWYIRRCYPVKSPRRFSNGTPRPEP